MTGGGDVGEEGRGRDGRDALHINGMMCQSILRLRGRMRGELELEER